MNIGIYLINISYEQTIKNYNGDERYHTRADGTAYRRYGSKLFIRLYPIDQYFMISMININR
jgi:hypothetical protein